MEQQRTIADDLFGKGRSQTINQKQKGNMNERVAAKVLQEWTGAEFVRVPQSGGLRWKNADNITGDIMCTKKRLGFPFSVETKHVASLAFTDRCGMGLLPKLRSNSTIYTYWKQASDDAVRSSKVPMLMVRQNGMEKKTFYLFLPDWCRQIVGCSMVEPFVPIVCGKGLVGYESKKFFSSVDAKKFFTFVKSFKP